MISDNGTRLKLSRRDLRVLAHRSACSNWLCAHSGELLFGFVEENANEEGTVGGRFINATLTAGQTFFIPQGQSAVSVADQQQCETQSTPTMCCPQVL